MIITDVRSAGLSGATPPGGWKHELTPQSEVHALIAVHTDGGVVGLGSAFTSGRLVDAAVHLLRPFLIGQSALEPRRLTEDLHQATFWQGRGGAVTHAISGINIALWDVFGQATGQPIGRLLGGGYRTHVRPYASILMSEPASLRHALEKRLEQGFTAFKIGWGPFGRVDRKLDEAIVAAARATVADGVLAVDAGGSDGYWPHGFKWANETARMLRDYDVAWFEEPLQPDDTAGYRQLVLSSPVPISGGEVLTRRQAFAPLIEQRCFDIVQPDVTKVGGIDEAMSIARQAEDRQIQVIPHGWNTAVGLVADLHLASAIAGTNLVEYCAGSAYIDAITAEPWTLDSSGCLPVPGAAGLGVEWDQDAIRSFTQGIDLFALR